MTANPTPSTSQSSPVSFILMTAGIVITLAGTIDFLTLLFPDPTPTSVDWRLNTVTQLVDRGVVPLLGFSLFLFGSWVKMATQEAKPGRARSVGTLSILVFIVSGIVGLIYLGLAPFHLRDSGIASSNALSQISRQAEQAEQQLDSRINQELSAISGLLGDEARLEQLQNLPGELTPDQQQQVDELLAQIEEFKKDPASLQNRAEENRDQLLSRIRLQRQELEAQIQRNSWKSSVRIPFSSILLAIGYLFIAINGIQRLLT